MALVVKTDGDPLALAEALLSVVRRLDPEVPVSRVRTMTDVVDTSIATPRLASHVLSLFAVAAFALCAVGVYGVLARGVAERRQELAVRLALGAEARHVTRLVLAEGLLTVGSGAALGLAAAAGLSRFLGTLLYAVPPSDGATYASVTLALLAVAVLAGVLPATIAARTDPSAALRAE
jgi:ABC-type antimicrobial peptide transport system permease subunit